MSASRRARLVAGAAAVVALVAVAGVLVALAADVLRWDRQMRRDDIAYAAGGAASWTPDTLLPIGISSALLGVDDDVDFRRAVDQFWLSDPRAPLRVFTDVTRRNVAERTLIRAADDEGTAARRSVLTSLRGVLLVEEARNSPIQRSVFVRRAIEQFRRAAQLDSENVDAVFNLELALKLLRESSGDAPSNGDARSPLPSPGAGSASSGSGY